MNLLIKDKSSEKTTGFIYTSEVTRYPIVTFNRISINCIKNMVRDTGCLIPEPLFIEDFKSDPVGGRRLPDNVLLDEVSVIIGDALKAYPGTNIVAVTMTDSLREHYDRMKKAE